MYKNRKTFKPEAGSNLEKVFNFINNLDNKPTIYSNLGKKTKGVDTQANGTSFGFYSTLNDYITIHQSLFKEKFPKDHEACTILHELGHWTGAVTRLNRTVFSKCKKYKYALDKNMGNTIAEVLSENEEVIADLFMLKMTQVLGLSQQEALSSVEEALKGYSNADLPMCVIEADRAVAYILSKVKTGIDIAQTA